MNKCCEFCKRCVLAANRRQRRLAILQAPKVAKNVCRGSLQLQANPLPCCVTSVAHATNDEKQAADQEVDRDKFHPLGCPHQ